MQKIFRNRRRPTHHEAAAQQPQSNSVHASSNLPSTAGGSASPDHPPTSVPFKCERKSSKDSLSSSLSSNSYTSGHASAFQSIRPSPMFETRATPLNSRVSLALSPTRSERSFASVLSLPDLETNDNENAPHRSGRTGIHARRLTYDPLQSFRGRASQRTRTPLRLLMPGTEGDTHRNCGYSHRHAASLPSLLTSPTSLARTGHHKASLPCDSNDGVRGNDIATLQGELGRYDAFITNIGDKAMMWSIRLSTTAKRLASWTEAFGRAAFPDGKPTDAFNAFQTCVVEQTSGLSEGPSFIIEEEILPQLEMLRQTISGPRALLANISSLDALKIAWQEERSMLSSLPSALLEASQGLTALRTKLESELSVYLAYLRLLDKGILACLRRIICLQAAYWAEVSACLDQASEILGLDRSISAEQGVQMWRAVDQELKQLWMCQATNNLPTDNPDS